MKLYKLVRVIKQTIETKPTHNLLALRSRMELLQSENPNDDFAIIDTDGNPVEIDDFNQAEFAKANLKKAAQELEYRELVKTKLARYV
jgi:hypothetical protein